MIGGTVEMATYNGTSQDNTYSGGNGNDRINGNGGNDTLSGGGGNDTISGGIGDDWLLGGSGADSISGDDGADYIDGGIGNDTLSGGTGADTILGDAGRDSILGGDGDDSLDGGDDNDTISGDAGNDTLAGGAGADSLSGGDGNDVIDGGEGNDTLNGGSGDDTLHGGAGSDAFNGGSGIDLVDYSDSASAVNVNLSTGSASGGDAAGDSFSGVDGIIGSAYDDTLVGFDGESTSGSDIYTNVIYGNAGDDYISGLAGSDSLYGGADDDTVLGGDGNDLITGDEGDDSLDGGNGNDTIYGGDGDDTLIGGAGNDYLDGGSGADVYDGGAGSDTIVLSYGDTGTIDGSEDSDNGDTDVLILNGRAKVIYDEDNPENGTIRWADGSTTTFSNIETVQVVPCFTLGTLITTREGPVPVEALRPGDRVLTRDNGFQPIRWIGSRRLGAAELAAAPALQPVQIARGALGQGLPEADLLLSPQHRMLISTSLAELLFGEGEVLAAAIHMLGWPGVTRRAVSEVTYLHLMFDTHQIIRANGAWSESYQPGARTLNGLDDPQREELLTIFPELRETCGGDTWTAARRSLRAHEVRVLRAA